MANRVRLILLQPEGTPSAFDWIRKLTDGISRLGTVQENIVEIVQFHSSPAWTEDFAKLGLNVAAYEGVVEVWFETIDELVSLFGSPEHVEAMMPDEAVFVNLEESGVMIGVDVVETKKYTATSGV